MTIREELVSKVNEMPDDSLAEVADFVRMIEGKRKPSLMETLRRIKIDGPRDLSRNARLYINGEKEVDENSD